MGTIKWITAVMMGAVLFSSDPALARREGKGMPMAEELDLTKEQKSQLKEMREKNREQHRARREAMDAAREEMEQALKSDASDKQLREKFEKLEKLQSEFAKERFDHILAIRAILTPEQRAKFRGMGGGPGERGEGRMGRMEHKGRKDRNGPRKGMSREDDEE